MIDAVVRLLERRDLSEVQTIYSEPGAYGNTLQLQHQFAEHWEKSSLGRGSCVRLRSA